MKGMVKPKVLPPKRRVYLPTWRFQQQLSPIVCRCLHNSSKNSSGNYIICLLNVMSNHNIPDRFGIDLVHRKLNKLEVQVRDLGV